MKIRNIISAAAMVAVLGLAGGSVYADDGDSDVNDEVLTVSADAIYSGNVFVYTGDYDEREIEIVSTDGIEQARLAAHVLETLEIN